LPLTETLCLDKLRSIMKNGMHPTLQNGGSLGGSA
jgi:hypothetical protein